MRKKEKKTCNNNKTRVDNRVEKKWKVWGEGVGGEGGEQISNKKKNEKMKRRECKESQWYPF